MSEQLQEGMMIRGEGTVKVDSQQIDIITNFLAMDRSSLLGKPQFFQRCRRPINTSISKGCKEECS
jgi:hypothetical protein